MKTIVSLIGIIMFAAACSSPSGRPDILTGDWSEKQTGSVWQFRRDGSVSIIHGNSAISGTFRRVDEQQIALTVPGVEEAGTNRKIDQLKVRTLVAGTHLTLYRDGRQIELTKID